MSASPALPGRSKSEYWQATRRPLCCLIFLSPLLAAYEAGVLWLGGRDSSGLRNGADQWIRDALSFLGLNQPWLLPAAIVVGLFVWHVASGDPWKVSFDTLLGMLAESLLFAFVLIVLGQLQDGVFRNWSQTTAALIPARTAALALMFMGAGIYEEFLFRLCLLPVFAGLFRAGGVSRGTSAALAILATSLAFSLAHYVGPNGEEFRMFTFVFRAAAGAFFAGLFVLRGFGISVGTHAAYDLIVGLVLSGGATS